MTTTPPPYTQPQQLSQDTAATPDPSTPPPPPAAATDDNDSSIPQAGLSWDGEGYTPLVFGSTQQWRPVPSVLELVDRCVICLLGGGRPSVAARD